MTEAEALTAFAALPTATRVAMRVHARHLRRDRAQVYGSPAECGESECVANRERVETL